jgi:protein-serine/threonine kinase
MDVCKALAFAGFTHKSPRAVEYMRADGAFDNLPSMQHVAKDTGLLFEKHASSGWVV